MEVVKFRDGKYGIRRRSYLGKGYEFRGVFASDDVWWNSNENIKRLCKGTLTQVTSLYNSMDCVGEPVQLMKNISIPVNISLTIDGVDVNVDKKSNILSIIVNKITGGA